MLRKYSTKDAKFFFLDGKVALPLLLVMLSPSMTLLGVLFVFSLILWVLKGKGMDLSMLFRRLRTFFSGNRKEIRSRFRKLM